MTKPDCYKCKYVRSLPGDAHKACANTKARVKGNEMKIKSIDAEKESIISNAALPLQGLGFNDTGVTYQGRPLSDCSGMEKLEISAAIGMSMKKPEGINVMRIADGSSIDSEHLHRLREMCRNTGFQLWIETVDETGEVGFYIEDGELVEDNYNDTES